MLNINYDNNKHFKNIIIKIKGWIVGNPVTTPDTYNLLYYGSFGVEDLNTLINFGIMN